MTYQPTETEKLVGSRVIVGYNTGGHVVPLKFGTLMMTADVFYLDSDDYVQFQEKDVQAVIQNYIGVEVGE